MLARPPKDRPKSMRLDDAAVGRLPLAERGQYIVRDTELKGFFVVVGRNARTYTYQADANDGGVRRTIRKSLGRHGQEGVTAREARRQAKLALGEVQTATKLPAASRGGVTLAEAWARYRALLEKKGRQAGGIEFYRACLEDGPLTKLLDVPLRRMTAASIAKHHDDLTQSSGPYRANGAMRTLRAIYNDARRRDRSLPIENPTCLVEWNAEERRDTGMSTKELPAWKAKLDALPNPIRREFHLFCLLSGSRPDALSRARWEQLDVSRRLLHFPDPKGGTKKAFDMPLSRAMLECLVRVRKAGRQLHNEQSQTWIFPALSSSGHLTEWKEERDELPKWGNDLRQTYKTLSVEVGVVGIVSKILMNHAFGDVNEDYTTRGALGDHIRAAQEKISRHITKHLNGKQR